MVWWILLGGLVLGLLVLALAARPVLARLPALHRAVSRLQRRAEEAQQMQAGVEKLAVGAQALARSVPSRPRRAAGEIGRRAGGSAG